MNPNTYIDTKCRCRILEILDQNITDDSVRAMIKGGKRIRAILVGILTKWCNPEFIVAIECLHKSSFGTKGMMVILGHDYITKGYHRIETSFGNDPERRRVLDQEIGNLLGIDGFSKTVFNIIDMPVRMQRELMLKHISATTGSIFGLAFILGWLALNRQIEYVHNIRDIGVDFGMCYYLCFNLCFNLGFNSVSSLFTRNEIIDMFIKHNQSMVNGCKAFGIWNDDLRTLNTYMINRFKSNI